MSEYYTQEELLNKQFNNTDTGILGGLLKTGLYIMGANSKVGKTMIATTLANAVATGTEYLGKPNSKGKVIYYDNDNYDFEAKSRIQALGLSPNPNIKYVFGREANSLREIRMKLEFGSERFNLVIIDCFINLDDFAAMNIDYQTVYPIIKDFRDFIVKMNLICIILHHTKKGSAVGQDRLLGPKAMSGATTGSIIINVEDEFSTMGNLEFILRHKKEIIPIIKDEKGIGWDRLKDDTEIINEEIPKNLLMLINSVVSNSNHELIGSAQELVQKTKMEINPCCLYKYLVKYQRILNQNGIEFEKKRTHSSRQIIVKYEEKISSASDASDASLNYLQANN